MSEISAADLETLIALRKKGIEATSEEMRAKAKAMRAEAMSDENKEATMEKMKAGFTKADADGDGRLNEAEFIAFTRGIGAAMREKGVDLPEASDDDLKTVYAIHNKSSADDGVSALELMANMAQINEAMKAQGLE